MEIALTFEPTIQPVDFARREPLLGHLEDGSAATAYHGQEHGSVHAFSLATSDGRTTVTQAFVAEPSRRIAAREPQASFPVDWPLRTAPEVEDPSVDLRFETTAGGQAVRVLGVPFWVGRCAVSGTVSDAPVRGSGYVLLRGTPVAADPRE